MRWHLANGTTRLAEGSGLLDLVLYDSNPFIKKYRDSGWAKVPGGLRDQNTALIKWVTELLGLLGGAAGVMGG